jgi:hypothetical protein
MKKCLKICDLPQGGGYVPGINLKGNYLKEFGFTVGDFVDVCILENQIVITKTDATDTLSYMAKRNPAVLQLINEFDLIPV